jgi:chromate reductase, NAD(P)H dehydrogenase (quinone)
MISLIVGTNRPGNNTLRVAGHIQEYYAELKVPFRILDLAKLPPEVFLPSAYAEKPASFRPWMETIVQSAGLVVVTPEYNGGMPGVLKYFIDLLPFPESFCMRPVCFVGLSVGQWGALRPVEQLQDIFGYRKAFIFPERVLIPKIREVLDPAGRIASREILGRLKSQAQGFVEFTERLQGIKQRETT